MARGNFRGRRSTKDINRKVKKKPCALCRDQIEWVDYKDVNLLRRYMSDRGKIRSRRVTGNCAQHQRDIAEAIKTARELVLLPYTQRTVTERPGTRTRREGRADLRDRGPAPTEGIDRRSEEDEAAAAAPDLNGAEDLETPEPAPGDEGDVRELTGSTPDGGSDARVAAEPSGNGEGGG